MLSEKQADPLPLTLQLSSTDEYSEQHRSKCELPLVENSIEQPMVHRSTRAWGWIIVFSSFCLHFVADGVLFSFGLLMHMIKDDLKIELHVVGIVASLFASLPLLLAPLSSALVNKFGCRCVAMLGGFLGSLGLFCASMLGNFLGAFIGIGILCGTSLSCIYVPAVVIVAHYFDEHRAIATAIAVGGTGLGNAIVAQLIHVLNDYYHDWRDTTLLLSAVFFTTIGFGALFRPVEFSYHHMMSDEQRSSVCKSSIEKSQCFSEEVDEQRKLNQSVATVSQKVRNLSLYDSYSADDIKELENESAQRVGSFQNFTAQLFNPPLERRALEYYYQPINQTDIFYRGNMSITSLRGLRSSCPNLPHPLAHERSLKNDNASSTDHSRSQVLFYHKGLSFLHTLRRMFGLHLFYDYRYLIFFISQFLFYLFYDLIYLFPVDYGETVIGYSKQQMTLLVTILGVGQFFGQILFGILANYSPIDELMLYNIGAVLCGIASLLVPKVAHSYFALIAVILLFGLAISANYVLTSIILANMCGLELLTSAYGLILLGQGLSSLFGPVVGGWIAETYGYKASLITAGIFMTLSGVVTLLIPLIKRLRKRENDVENDQNATTVVINVNQQ